MEIPVNQQTFVCLSSCLDLFRLSVELVLIGCVLATRATRPPSCQGDLMSAFRCHSMRSVYSLCDLFEPLFYGVDVSFSSAGIRNKATVNRRSSGNSLVAHLLAWSLNSSLTLLTQYAGGCKLMVLYCTVLFTVWLCMTADRC